jgi:hypothetical protein
MNDSWQIFKIPTEYWVALGKRLVIQDDARQTELDQIVDRARAYWRSKGSNRAWRENPDGLGINVAINELSETLARVRRSGRTQAVSVRIGRLVASRDGTVLVPILATDKRAASIKATEEISQADITQLRDGVSASLTREQWQLMVNALEFQADRITNQPLSKSLRALAELVRDLIDDRPLLTLLRAN